jgi:transposase
MSGRELERVEVLGRVASKGLKLKDAAAMLQLSYRQAKRLWRRYQQAGAKGLQHGNAGKASNRSKAAKFRRKVVGLVKKKYGGSEEERFGPTLVGFLHRTMAGQNVKCMKRNYSGISRG